MPNQHTPPSIRVVVKLPHNRPEEALPDPPRVEWNPEKEQILWEVIAKSRAVEGAGTDWKGLATHLQVPLPYLLFRAQTRYEEDLRGLQGIRGAFSPTITSPTSQMPINAVNGIYAPAASGSKPNSAAGEYFPKLPTPVSGNPRKDFSHMGVPNGTNGTMTSSMAARSLNVRARLSSLSHSSRTRKMSSLSQQSKYVLGSSVLTLQGPKRSREHIQRLSPTTSSRASPSAVSSNDASSEEENDKVEEEERRAEEQQALDLKLKNLQKIMTRETLGLVASSTPLSLSRSQFQGKGKEVDRGRMRPLSASSASVNFPHRPDASRRHSTSQTPSHHSLSSASSPQGSIPSIPSPPPERRSQPQSPMARRLSEQFKSTSPPTVSTRSAWAHSARHGMVSRTKMGGGKSEKGSEMGSEASSFSDLSDASLSASALESALMSNIRGGSRFSSIARSTLPGRRGSVR